VFVRSVTLKHHFPVRLKGNSHRLMFSHLLDQHVAKSFKAPIDCGQFSLFTTSWPNVLRLPRALLCSIPYADCGECSLPDNG
jgi:hypothetical protein